MHVAVAIVGFRNTDDIVRCVAALDRSTHRDFEVVICENGGPEAHAKLTAAIPRVLSAGQPVRAVLASHNLGYAGGVNVCLVESPGAEAWWVLNPDTVPEPDAMAGLAAKLSDGTCEAVGCPLHLASGMVQSYGGRWQGWIARPVSIGHGNPLNVPTDPVRVERSQNYLNGASMLIGRRFLVEVGLMREDYFLYCEEVEWCLRGVARGMRLGFAPDARVLHFQGTTTGAGGSLAGRSRLSIYLGERNKILTTRDCFPGRLPVATLSALLLHVWRFGRCGAWRQLGYGLAGLWAGLSGERGAPAWAELGTREL
jgi:N-acetylglucosaminyl-diphospho-decaprenol L-rhamnosyltransferase